MKEPSLLALDTSPTTALIDFIGCWGNIRPSEPVGFRTVMAAQGEGQTEI